MVNKIDQDELKKALSTAFHDAIIPSRTVIRKAVDAAIAGHESDTKWLASHFSILAEEIQSRAYSVYLEAELKAGIASLAAAFEKVIPHNADRSETIRLFSDCFTGLDRFFLGLTQGRRPRAGKAFEVLIHDLFTRLGYPFSSQPIINGQPDFLLPSIDHFRNYASDCIIFTVKRTLRERWRQIVTEGTRGLGFFLATIDEGIALRDLNDMRASRVTLVSVVPARIKKCRSDYEAANNVITFENFFQYHLDPSMSRWRAAGVIK